MYGGFATLLEVYNFLLQVLKTNIQEVKRSNFKLVQFELDKITRTILYINRVYIYIYIYIWI